MKTFFIICSLLLCVSAYADDILSGYVGLGGVYMRSSDKTAPAGDMSRITDDSFSKTLFAPSAEIKFTPEQFITFHIGKPKDMPVPDMTAGVTFRLPDRQAIDVSALYNPFMKTWKNPYADNREKTDMKSYGGMVRYMNILGSDFFAEGSVVRHEIDDDAAAKLYDTLGRNGVTTAFKSGFMSANSEGRSGLFFEAGQDDNNGTAESDKFTGAGIFFKMKDFSGNDMGLHLSARSIGFNAKNPYFDKTRNDSRFSAMSSYTINSPFGLENEYVSLSTGYVRNFSNIDFFDYSSLIFSISAGVNF